MPLFGQNHYISYWLELKNLKFSVFEQVTNLNPTIMNTNDEPNEKEKQETEQTGNEKPEEQKPLSNAEFMGPCS